MKKVIEWELRNHLDDGITTEFRYFHTYAFAKAYAESEGYVNYKIVPSKWA